MKLICELLRETASLQFGAQQLEHFPQHALHRLFSSINKKKNTTL